MTVSPEGSCACKLTNLTLSAQEHLLFRWDWKKSSHFPVHCAVNLDLGDFCRFVCFLQSNRTVDIIVLLSTLWSRLWIEKSAVIGYFFTKILEGFVRLFRNTQIHRELCWLPIALYSWFSNSDPWKAAAESSSQLEFWGWGQGNYLAHQFSLAV